MSTAAKPRHCRATAAPKPRLRKPRPFKLRCKVCGSPDWMACKPGTSISCRAIVFGKVVKVPARRIANVVWCRTCWPWWREPAVDPASLAAPS
jgi:hypothetical protein